LWKHRLCFSIKISGWGLKISDVLDIGELPVPQVLLLRMSYHWIVVMLFGIFGERQDFSMMPFPQAEGAQENRIQSAKEIAQCSRIHRLSYGLNHAPSHMVHPISAGLFVLLNELNDTESQEAFIELSRHLSALSRRIVHCKVIIRKLELTAQQSSINLPPLSSHYPSCPSRTRRADHQKRLEIRTVLSRAVGSFNFARKAGSRCWW